MRPRRLLMVTALIAAVAGPPATVAGPSVPAERPNLLLITLDCTRSDHLGSYGYPLPTSPNLDRLARQGVLFETAIAQIPLTGPSHATMMTGLYPHQHGAVRNGVPLPQQAITLAERLKEAGYATGAFLSGWTLRKNLSGLSQGFDLYDDRMQDRYRLVNSQRFAHQVTPHAAGWLERNAATTFFLWVHYFDPHAPYLKRNGYIEALDLRGVPPENRPLGRTLRYDSEVHYMDSWIGSLLEVLRRHDLEDRTLIVVTGDHGESLGEQGRVGHGRHLPEEVLRVPLILAWPGTLPEGTVLETPASHLDVAPTVLDLLKLPPLEKVQGVSLAPIIMGDPGAPDLDGRRIAFETYPGARRKFWRIFSPRLKMVPIRAGFRIGHYKFLYDRHSERAQIFDLASGGEGANLIDRFPDIRHAGEEFIRHITSSAPLVDEVALKPDEEERLRSLGYVD